MCGPRLGATLRLKPDERVKKVIPAGIERLLGVRVPDVGLLAHELDQFYSLHGDRLSRCRPISS